MANLTKSMTLLRLGVFRDNAVIRRAFSKPVGFKVDHVVRKTSKEEGFFQRVRAEQLRQLRDELHQHRDEEIAFHQDRINSHKECIRIHSQKVTDLMQKQLDDKTE